MDDKFKILQEEHSRILHCLQELNTAFQRKEMDKFSDLIKKLEHESNLHYDREEELFSKVFGHTKLSEGGPFCSLYFDRFMTNRPLQNLTRLIQKIEPNYCEPKPFSYYTKYFSTNSPLSVPCEEHLAVLVLLRFLLLNIQDVKKMSSAWLSEALGTLNQWIRFNHEKEEQCLFQMIKHILSIG